MKKLKVQTTTYNKPVGYISPVSNVNEGKKQEFENRVNFKI
jgi:anaerobic ribonucleoside-triphosphate reductase